MGRNYGIKVFFGGKRWKGSKQASLYKRLIKGSGRESGE